MIITKMHLSRRTLLRGLGVTLALPVLDSMIPALSALANTGAAPVKRLGVFYVPNGMSMPYWFPKAEGTLTEMPPTLQSLAAFKDRVLLCGGLADEPANRVKGGGDHARSAGTFLTGVPFNKVVGTSSFVALTTGATAALLAGLAAFEARGRTFPVWLLLLGRDALTAWVLLYVLVYYPAWIVFPGRTQLALAPGLVAAVTVTVGLSVLTIALGRRGLRVRL